MIKFTKILENYSLPSNEDVEDYFLELTDKNFSLEFFDGYISKDNYFVSEIEQTNQDSRYCKCVYMKFNYSSDSVSLDLFKKLDISTSRLDVLSNEDMLKFTNYISLISSLLKRFQCSYFINIESDRIRLFLIGEKISNNDIKYKSELSEMYKKLQDDINPLLEKHFKNRNIKCDMDYGNKIRIHVYYGSIRSGDESKLFAIDCSLSNTLINDDRIKKIPEFVDLYNKYLKMGYKISCKWGEYSDINIDIKLDKI